MPARTRPLPYRSNRLVDVVGVVAPTDERASLSITHGDDGIKVSVICPQYVATPMLGYDKGEGIDQYSGVISPKQVADTVVHAEQFLILPHPEVAQFIQFKTANYDRWLGDMRKLRRNILSQIGNTRLQDMHTLV